MPDPFFSRSNQEGDQERSSDDVSEGVRILGAEEAAEAAERDDVARRQPRDRPRYGDRPPPPTEGARPALRFPLPDAADPASVERPRAAPVPPRLSFDPAPEGEGPEGPPVISVGSGRGDAGLPHWTDPPTGEVPRVVIGEGVDDDADETARWAAYASSGPRWRDEHDTWDPDDVSDLAGDEAPITPPDTGRGLTQEEYLGFDDLEVPVAPVGAARPRPPVRPAPPPGQDQRPQPPRPAPPEEVDPFDDEVFAPAPPGPPRGGGRGRHLREPADGGPGAPRDVPQAAFVGVAIAAVAILLFWLGPAPTMILVLAALVVAAAELFEGLRRGGHRPATLLGLVAVAALPLSVYWRGEAAIPLVLFLTVVFAMLWYLLGIGGSARPVAGISVTVFGVLYVGLLGSFAALVLDIPAEGVSILLVAVVAAVASEVVGFFVGRSIGRTPLSSVSPHKTLEGLVGGFLGAMFATFVVAVVLGFGPFGLGSWFVFALCCSVAAPVGDLAESLLKRDLGLKDMGTVLPGHGGVLDRIDGLLLVLPTAYYVVRLLDLVPL